VYAAWGCLIDAGAKVEKPMSEPFRYDLVDVGREVLAQFAGPAANNFTAAISRTTLIEEEVSGLIFTTYTDFHSLHLEPNHQVEATGSLYAQVLMDLDTLVGTDQAFMLGPWLESARKLGGNGTDCNGTLIGDLECADFMEWNARW
jgi:hypothetical protein